MQVLIMYYSRSGNTRKLAEEIARGVREVKGIDCLLKSCAEVTQQEFASSDGIIAGSPVYFGSMAAELKAVFEKFVAVRGKMGGKVGAAFATSHDYSGGKETTMLSILQAMLTYGMIVVGDPLDATGNYGVSCADPLDRTTASHAFKLGKRVATLIQQLAK